MAKASLPRVKIIDRLAQQWENKLGGRENLLKLLNKELRSQNEKPIDLDQLSKDIKYLNEQLASKKTDVTFRCIGKRGYHYSKDNYSFFKDTLSEEDRYMLQVGTGLFSQFRGTSLEPQFEDMAGRVLSTMTGLGQVEGLADVEIFGSRSIDASDAKFIWHLLQSILKRECIQIRYKGINGSTELKRAISPYLLKNYSHSWYLIAHDRFCTRSEKVNIYRLDRVEDIALSSYEYINSDFSTDDYFKYTLGIWTRNSDEPLTVELEFTDHIPFVINHPLAPLQTNSYDKARKLLKVSFPAYDSWELDRMIIGFGTAVKVISPSSLVKRIKAKALAIAKMYGKH